MASPTDPIAIRDWQSNAGSYKGVAVNTSDIRHGDPLVKIRSYGIAGESFYARTDGKNWPYNSRIAGSLDDVWCRRLVAQKLQRVNVLLNTHRCELYVWDAYRPVTCQAGLWQHFMELAKRQHPGATDEEQRSFVLNYVSDPTSFNRPDSTTWPVHTSGAAVDLTLRNLETGELLDMGARFDEMSEVSHSDYFEREREDLRTERTEIVRRNRRLLYWAMAEEGFVNYPLEFWHYDWGNQMYVFNRRAMGMDGPDAAWFGYVDLPEAE